MNSHLPAVFKSLRCLVACFGIVLSGCASASRETVRHGDLNYNVTEVFGATPALALAKAAGRGDTVEIARQLAAGVDINTVGAHWITPLWWVAWVENYDGFVALLEKGANPNYVRKEGLSLMLYVTRMKDARFLETVLKHKGDPNLLDRGIIETPIFRALMLPDRRNLDLLLAAGADLNMQDEGGWTPAMRAIAAAGEYKIVWEFLQRGADPTLKTKNGKTLADIIEFRMIDADSESYVWRGKVIEYLRGKGIVARRPPNELPRTKPLPVGR